MRSHKFFKTLFGKKKFIIWTDTGTHFRNNQFVNYLFNELKKDNILVEWNLFAEKHGNKYINVRLIIFLNLLVIIFIL